MLVNDRICIGSRNRAIDRVRLVNVARQRWFTKLFDNRETFRIEEYQRDLAEQSRWNGKNVVLNQLFELHCDYCYDYV